MVFQIVDGKLILYVDPELLTDDQWSAIYNCIQYIDYHKNKIKNLPKCEIMR